MHEKSRLMLVGLDDFKTLVQVTSPSIKDTIEVVFVPDEQEAASVHETNPVDIIFSALSFGGPARIESLAALATLGVPVRVMTTHDKFIQPLADRGFDIEARMPDKSIDGFRQLVLAVLHELKNEVAPTGD